MGFWGCGWKRGEIWFLVLVLGWWVVVGMEKETGWCRSY